MISVTPYRFDRRLSAAFIDFMDELYRDDAGWFPPDRSLLEARFDRRFPFYRTPGNSHRHFIATEEDSVVGHVSAIVNRDLKVRDGTAVAAVGLFECVDDQAVAEHLLTAAVDWLRTTGSYDRVWGPIDFDIWRRYRFMTRGFSQPPFFGEPYNKPYYPGLFEACGFSVCRRWSTIKVIGREALEDMISPLESRYDKSRDVGFSFRSIDLGEPSNLAVLHAVMVRCIEGFVGYTPLSSADLSELAGGLGDVIDPRLVCLGCDAHGQPVAFSLCFPDRSTTPTENLGAAVFYLVGVVPENRRTGLGSATFYHAVRNMIDAGYDSVTIALLAEDSSARPFLGERMDHPAKEYALYEFRP
jgi:GNAT superfamily N-acetyltransferase